ncbi:unnamed protein product [Bursaphelenchus xylophilus]|uniref:(pine wood nematode) hypothetical protein n=1 Tax=Bursaphelenchus xylophilus TaxID=6326 RepID=A0A1I7RXB3_BURXY|nr:unnamed protein product [Bursaphelenchus xylophilus]CAG9121510.1 unnamed protein product [Bursaphelenchus xylophilus]
MASTDRTAEEPSEALAGEVYPIGRHALDDPNLFDVKTEPYEPEENPLPKSDEGFSCDELSDITEEFDRVRSVGTSQLSGLWHSQLRPLFQHPHMKYVALANLILFLVVVFLLALMVALAIVAAVFHYEALVNNESEIPCVYEWMEWSQCSATCRTPDQPVPTKSRSVDPKSIIRARGRMYQTAPCPERVSQLTDSAPCNTHWCPIKLSTLKFKECKYSVRHNKNIRLRDIPMEDQLIELDEERIYREC